MTCKKCIELQKEVKFLEEEIDGYHNLLVLQNDREKPWIKLWQEETNNPGVYPDYGKMLAWLSDKAELKMGTKP